MVGSEDSLGSTRGSWMAVKDSLGSTRGSWMAVRVVCGLAEVVRWQ